MEGIIIKQAEEIRNAHKLELEELIEYGKACEVAVKKPIGLMGRTCPKCHEKLKFKKHSFNPAFMTGFQMWEWFCRKCGYRFVEERNFTDAP